MLRILISTFLIFAAGACAADDLPVEHSNTLSLEALGRAAGYSLNYDRALNRTFSLGVGVETVSIGGSDNNGVNASLFVLPVYANYYFYRPGANRMFATLGLDFINASAHIYTNNFTGHFLAGTAGVGYEYRGESGFLFRGALYALLSGGLSRIWPGLSLGYSF